MGNGTTQQDPTQAAFDQSAQVPDVPLSGKEKVFSVLKGLVGGSGTKEEPSALDQAIQKHHQQRLDEARMHKRTAATALGIWAYGKDPKGNDLSPEEEQRALNEWNSAMDAYAKVAGVNKQTKAAITQNRQIAESIAQRERQKRKQSGPGQYALNVGEGGVTPNPAANAPPPVPQSSSTGAAPAGPQGGPPPPVPFADVAPFYQARVVDQEGRESKLRDEKAAFDQRSDLVKKVFPPEQQDSLAAQEFRLTGKFPTGTALTGGKKQKGPLMQDENGTPQETYFEPSDGTIHSVKTGEKVGDKWSPMSMSDLATKTVSLMTDDGPRIFFRKGNKLTDNDGNEIEGDLVPFQRGMLNTETDREVAVYNPQTNKYEKKIFRSTRKVLAGLGSRVATSTTPDEGSGEGEKPKGKVVFHPQGGAAAGPPPPVPSGGTRKGGKDSGPPSWMPVGAVNAANKMATPVRGAIASLVGDDPEKLGGLAGDLDVFKDPKSVERISNYLALIDKVTETERQAASGSGPLATVQWLVGLPQTLINLQQGALRDASAELAKHPQDAKFVADYFRALGTIGGMRSTTGASAAKWSYEVLRKELPAPGRTNYADAKQRILNYVREANQAGQNNPLATPRDTEKLDKQLGSSKEGGGEPTPPRAAKPGMKWQHRTVQGKVEWREVPDSGGR